MAARWPDVDGLVERIDAQLDDEPVSPTPPAGSFTGGCSCRRHVLARCLTDWRGQRAALAPLLPRRWRP